MSDVKPTLPLYLMAALANGYHGDPFSLLGPHVGDAGILIRAFLPETAQVELLIGEESHLMAKVYAEGLFEITLPDKKTPIAYKFRLTDFAGTQRTIEDPYRFTPDLNAYDTYLMAEGTHGGIYEHQGAHLIEREGIKGVRFMVWAPNALRASVVGDFNGWDGRKHPMCFHPSGLWELFIPELGEGTVYKYEIKSHNQGYTLLKTDPIGFYSELRPNTASIVWDVNRYQWNDQEWLQNRTKIHQPDSCLSIYELHLGSWRQKMGIDPQTGQEKWDWLTYAELAESLIPYVKEMGYTHIELLPVMEHPFDGSWGYQVTGYFAPTSRYGTPDDFKAFVDSCHQAEIGVILDWVPAHFPKDIHGLAFFDGTHLYEHADPRKGEHPDWGTYIFNYDRQEVRQFLVSNALFWFDKYHIDGLRVDAVASMLYLDFSREPGQWVPNRFGGRENLGAIEFIRRLNSQIHEKYPDVLMIAEDSTSWPGMTTSTTEGGLGFDYKWNMGWMHDTLRYMGNDPIYRAYHHGSLAFSLMYAFTEKFVLPFSHDEVVHLKKSMAGKMPGDLWQKFANLRALYAFQYAHPGKKMLFMGGEFGQWKEWSEAHSLDWHLLEEEEKHKGVQKLVKELNRLYREMPALHAEDHSWNGFEWLDFQDARFSILSFLRRDPKTKQSIIIVCNFTPVPRHNYPVAAPVKGSYRELLNTDATEFGGSGVVNTLLQTEGGPWLKQPASLRMTLPPLAVVYLVCDQPEEEPVVVQVVVEEVEVPALPTEPELTDQSEQGINELKLE